MAYWTIPPREGVTVSVDDDDAIRIEQIALDDSMPASISIQPDDMPQFIRYLQTAHRVALENREQMGEEEE